MATFEEKRAYCRELCKKYSGINQYQIVERNEEIIKQLMQKFDIEREEALEIFLYKG